MNAPADYDLAQLRIPPNSLEAEQSVIGGLLIAGHHFDSVTEILTAEDFYHPQHRQTFAAMAALAADNKPIDLTTVVTALSSSGDLDRIGGVIYLAEIARGTPSASNIRAYASAVRERATLRNLILVGQQIAESGFEPDGKKSIELIDAAQAAVIALGDQGRTDGITPIKDHLRNLVAEWQRRSDAGGLVGLSTGFEALDARTNGLSPGDLIILAARPSMGKTALAMNIAENVAVHQGKPVLVFSLEMTAEQLLDRMASSVGKIPYDLIRTGNVFKVPEYECRAMPTISRIRDAPLHIDDRPALTIPQMRATARRVHKQTPLSLIVVDYLQLARAKAESRVMEVTQISQGLKALAKELGVPVLALSQLSRAVEQRADKRPGNADLRDSGAIEQDADVIWFIYRDEVYNTSTKQRGVAEILCTKQRNGPVGSDFLATLLEQCRFDNLARGWTPPVEEEKPKRRGGFDYQ
jgi:replicative DNA helicase